MENTALETLQPNSMKHLAKKVNALIKGRLWLKVLLGMFLGIGVGIFTGPTLGWLEPSTSVTTGNWLALPGQLFLTLIQMIVIPLIFASVIRGIASCEDFEQLRKIGVRTVLFFTATTAIAVILGLFLGLVIRPGHSINSEMLQAAAGNSTPIPNSEMLSAPSLGDLPQKLITILPGNPLNSMVEGQMLQVVLFALLIGIALVTMLPTQAKPMLDLLESLQEVCMTVVRWAMLLAPLAVFGLIAQLTMRIGTNLLVSMAVYVATVALGLFLMFALLVAIVSMFTKESPRSFLAASRDLLLLSFSTSSSAAVMPLSIKTAEEKLGVKPSISQFVIPLGATINMNGTALYQGVATIFLAQAYGIELGIGAMALVVVMAVGASIGSPGTPGVGIIVLAMVLTTVGIPAAGVALLMGVDRILDMSRTVVNVAGDLVACKLMNKWSH